MLESYEKDGEEGSGSIEWYIDHKSRDTRRKSVRKALDNTLKNCEDEIPDRTSGSESLKQSDYTPLFVYSQQIGPYQYFYNGAGYTGWISSGGSPINISSPQT